MCNMVGHVDKKNNKETLELNGTSDQMDLTNVYRIFHPTSRIIYSFLKRTWKSPQ